MISNELLAKVQRPLSYEEIQFRIGFDGKAAKPNLTRVLPYISSRCANSRLLELGLSNFQVKFGTPFSLSYDVTSYNEGTKTMNDVGVTCAIGLKFEDGWNWYEDGASVSAIDPVKGMLSDAKKRAATVIGIGEELYAYPPIFIGEDKIKQIPNWAYSKLEEVVVAVNAGKVTAKFIVLKENEPVNFEAHVEKQFINHNGEPSFMKAKELIQKGEIKNETELEAKFIFAKGTKSPADQLKMDKAKKELIALFA